MKRSLIALFAALLIGTGAYADGMKKDQAGMKGPEKARKMSMSQDKLKQSAVLNEIHHLNQKEIEMAKLVQKKAQSPELKQYAQTVLRDHEQSDKRLKELAKSQNIELSKYEPAGYEKTARSNLEKLSGTEFDQTFLDMTKTSNRQQVQDMKMTANEIQNPQIQQYVQNELVPALEKHQQTVAGITISGQAGEAGEMPGTMPEIMEDTTEPSDESRY